MMEWTLANYSHHVEALRAADERFHAERDRRYFEVSLEREKALKIKETADLMALSLAREIQTYKDEKANELRSQIERERGLYITQGQLAAALDKIEATMKPLVSFAATSQGKGIGLNAGWGYLLGVVGLISLLIQLWMKR